MNKQTKTSLYKSLASSIARTAFKFDSTIPANENAVFSPLNIYSILLVLMAGAKGQTRELLADFLNAPTEEEQFRALAATFNDLVQSLLERNELTDKELSDVVAEINFYERFQKGDLVHSEPPTQGDTRELILSVADSVWIQKDYEINLAYLEFLEESLNVESIPVDFQTKVAEACEQINQWTAEKTYNQIQLGISPDIITDLTRLIPISTLYFKGTWLFQFESPEKDRFILLSGEAIETDMMAQKLWAPHYLETPIYQAVRLPYKHRPLSMTIILPRQSGAEAFQKTTEQIQKEWHNLSYDKVNGFRLLLTMPTFNLKGDYNIINTIFEARNSTPAGFELDFTGITEDPAFFLNTAVHLSTIDVNQFGTVAAAASYALFAAGLPPKEVIEMKVNRPFLFAITDDPTNTLLFFGRVMDPR